MEYAQSSPVKQWAGNAVPTQSFATPDVERVLALDGISGQIADTNAFLADCVQRLRNIADSLLGGGLNSKAEGSTRPPVSGRVSGLSSIANDTRELVNQVRGEIERLSGL